MQMDLVILAADGAIAAALEGILSRRDALAIRLPAFKIFTHMHRDPGCFLEAHNFLRPFARDCKHGLVVFDRKGSGQESRTRVEIQEDVTRRLAANAWTDRAKAIVIDPELEAWVWSDSPQVDRCLGWSARSPALREWLSNQGLWDPSMTKPQNPELAFVRALREVRKPMSSSIFSDLARSVSLLRCRDEAFAELRGTLTMWFGGQS
jgi:hypothetical protein